jgi:hypothetical protein
LQVPGLYSNTWIPNSEGRYLLSVSYADAGLSNTESVFVKKTAPVLSVTVGQPPLRGPGGTDPSPPVAWRRDELANVTFFTSDLYFDVYSASAVLVALDGTLSTAGVSSPQVTVCPDAGYCGSLLVDLSQIRFPAFRGSLGIVVSGRDLAGNLGSADSGIPVTRWRWRFDVAGDAGTVTSPAVGAIGTVYFGTDAGIAYAINADGTPSWSFDGGGSFKASPAVGTGAGGERVYFAGKSSTAVNFFVLDGGSGSQTPVCVVPTTTGDAIGSPALAQTDAGEAAFFIVNGADSGTILAVRPDFAPLTCPYDAGTADLAYPSGIVTDGTSAFFGNSAPAVRQYFLDGGTWLPGWNVPVAQNVHGIGVNGTTLIAAGGDPPTQRPYLFAVPTDGGGVTFLTDGGATYPSIVGSGPNAQALVGVGNTLVQANLQGGAVVGTVSLDGGQMYGAPAIGSDRHIFIATSVGEVRDLNPDLSTYWSLLLPGTVPVWASPALDCSRYPDAGVAPRPGTLYVLSVNGTLYSFIVDSRGIDTTSAWPKYQRDPRNSGNSSVPLSQFICP